LAEADRRVAFDQNATEAAVTLIHSMSWTQLTQKYLETKRRKVAQNSDRRWAVYIETFQEADVDICFAGMNIRDNCSFSEDDEEAAGAASSQTSAAGGSSSREAVGSGATGKRQAESRQRETEQSFKVSEGMVP
jgi:hypothetical protein